MNFQWLIIRLMVFTFFFYDFKTFFSFARCNHTFSSLLPLFTTLRPLLANAWHLLTRDSHPLTPFAASTFLI